MRMSKEIKLGIKKSSRGENKKNPSREGDAVEDKALLSPHSAGRPPK